MLVLDEEERRVGVVELVGDLGRREAPRDRVQDRARLRAGEHQRDVLARVAGQRRDPFAVREPALRARRSARRARRRSSVRPASSIAIRSGVIRARSRMILSIVCSLMPRNSVDDPDERVGLLPEEQVPGAVEAARRVHPRSGRRAARALRWSTTLSSVPGEDQRRRGDLAVDALEASCPQPPAPASRPDRAGSRRAVRRARRRARPAGSRRARSRRSGAAPPRARATAPRRRARIVTSGIGTASGAARRRAAEHEPVDALGRVDGELLRDHPAEARPEHVRALDARLVEHLQRVAGHLRAVYGPSGLSDSPMPRLSNADDAVALARARARPGPSPSGRSRAPGSGAAARPLPCDSHAIFIDERLLETACRIRSAAHRPGRSA